MKKSDGSESKSGRIWSLLFAAVGEKDLLSAFLINIQCRNSEVKYEKYARQGFAENFAEKNKAGMNNIPAEQRSLKNTGNIAVKMINSFLRELLRSEPHSELLP